MRAAPPSPEPAAGDAGGDRLRSRPPGSAARATRSSLSTVRRPLRVLRRRLSGRRGRRAPAQVPTTSRGRKPPTSALPAGAEPTAAARDAQEMRQGDPRAGRTTTPGSLCGRSSCAGRLQPRAAGTGRCGCEAQALPAPPPGAGAQTLRGLK